MRNGNINMLETYNITDADRHPELALVTANLTDTTSGDGDNRADAGETIEFYPIFKNAWGQAENIRFWIKAGYYNQGDWVWDDTTLIHPLQDTAYFGKPLSSYAKATSLNPYRMTISPDCADGRKINMTFFAICDNAADTLRQTISLAVENGVEIGGMLTEDLTLYPNVHYILTSNLAVPDGVTLTIKPGTVLKLKTSAGFSIARNAKLIAHGTKDSIITFAMAEGTSKCNQILLYSLDTLRYIHFDKLYYTGSTKDCIHSSGILENCIIDVVSPNGYIINISAPYNKIIKTNLYNGITFYGGTRYNGSTFINCNYCNNAIKGNTTNLNQTSLNPQNAQYCNILGNRTHYGELVSLVVESSTPTIISTSTPSYYGSAKESIVRKSVYDFEHQYQYAYFDLSNMLIRPSAEAHGIVWKILVDGVDAQDEFEQLPPIGVGTHRCDVYFNRPMDVSVAPTISFGVRQPYTQHQVAENGSWSADSTIYTAYFTIDGKSVTDGLNTFKVSGAEDNEHFEIPEENYRFHMEVAAAGSMSTGLMAEAGLGKVTLTWETDEEDFADLLGYNIYRWTHDTIKWDLHYDNEKGQWIDAGWRIDP